MSSNGKREIIVVRSLTDSDLGLFAAHRQHARSKQRAININAVVAQQMLSPELFGAATSMLDCRCVFRQITDRSLRHFGKVGKNWRLGGNKLEGVDFRLVDSKDFILIRTKAGNDGSHQVSISFVARATDPANHASVVSTVEDLMEQSMAVFGEGTDGYRQLSPLVPPLERRITRRTPTGNGGRANVPPMPQEPPKAVGSKRSIREKIRSPHILEQMLRVSSDLSAPAQLSFMQTIEQLASQLRLALLESGRILNIEKNHRATWASVSGKNIAFIDGGLANLSMLGSAPIAARVGGYIVRPGDRSPTREQFATIKTLIDDLFAHPEGGVYDHSFPDIGALRDAARISIEAAGAVQATVANRDLAWMFLHGALVNPVSRYSDVMYEGKIRHRFPNFSEYALRQMLPIEEQNRTGRDANFVSVYLRQLDIVRNSPAVVCGVVERPSTTSSVCNAVLNSLDDQVIRDILPLPPSEWKAWFRRSMNPADADDDIEGQRITDTLLFRCVLEPGEALVPVVVDRNEMRRAPQAWKDVICEYPKPLVSYLQVTEWSPPVRVEIFEKDKKAFQETASLVMHSSLLLPCYAFPVGLDIVDKYARIPNWMSRPVNTHTAVQALKQALETGDARLFDALRRMLCGSRREWLLRPGVTK